MKFKLYHQLILFLTTISICLSEEYSLSINCEAISNQSGSSFYCENTNASIKVNDLYFDVFQWTIAATEKESIKIEFLDPEWELLRYNDKKVQLPKIIEFSDPKSFRGNPVIYLRISPFREKNGNLEFLKNGKIKLSIPPLGDPVTFKDPSLLNRQGTSLNRNISNNIEYLIITPSKFLPYALSLAKMHSSEVDESIQLKTEVVTTEEIASNISGIKIREYIINRINLDLINDGFLLLLGNENDIPPIYDFYNNYPSDDFYSTDSSNMYFGKAQLKSGRIPIENQNDAGIIVEKIRNYALNLEPGIWRSKIALIADDDYRKCSKDISELIHTQNSDLIFDSLTNLIPITPFYGINYNLQLTSDGCEYPDLTNDAIKAINSGFALINYTGHGDATTWADEKIISKNRDINSINPRDNKLAIWVAGTCSFGKYNNEDSFMEALLANKGGAIAIIASTDAIGYTPNREFIESIFGISNDYGIKNIINNNSKYYYKGKIRISELVYNSKNTIDNYNDYYKFHTFGDPALCLPFPTISNNIIDQSLESIKLVEEQTLKLNNTNKQTTLLVKESDQNILLNNFSYSIPGPTYAQIKSDSDATCFRIPLDAGACTNCKAKFFIYQDSKGQDGRIQIKKDIVIENSNEISEDTEGPKIDLFQNHSQISEGSMILQDLDLTVHLNDTSGINLMSTIGHGIRFAFNNDPLKLINGDEFIYKSCSEGKINIAINQANGGKISNFYLEAWDGLNNISSISMNFETISSSNSDFIISKVFPFPNPFKKSTNFTMFSSELLIDIKISIYSLNGNLVDELTKTNTENNFISIPWDGLDKSGNSIANGTYFYNLQAVKDKSMVYENIFKISKVK